MKFPVGYYKFHRNAFINYQLNRWYSLGYTRKEDIENIGSQIKTFDDYVSLFLTASAKALKENRLKNAATYCRAGEFLIKPDSDRKIPVYEEFISLFDRAFADEPYQRYQVPYQHSFLSVIRIPSLTNETKGTLITCGGFDSFIEEFYGIWKFLAEKGYDVIAFEGPGQGGTLRKHGLTFDHDWEKPVKAVLDHFKIEKAGALGISMGGYWIMRAAAFEKRITHVIAMPPVYDWMELTNAFNKKLVRFLMKFRGFMNFLIRIKMNAGILRHAIHNALYIRGKNEPIEAVDWMLGMNKEHLNSHLIESHVLLLSGENDAFQPPKLMEKQKEALLNAKSITTRIFTKEEHADQHCQMGNMGLALETVTDWLEEKKSI